MSGLSTITAVSRARRRTAFTLVEMLVVMGIIVLLLAATLPALRGLNQSESRRGAIGNMIGVLDRARMMAITDGLPTYVVFACKTSSPPPGLSQINPALWGRAYAIYQDADNITFKPVQKTPWLPLPKTISIKAPGNGIVSVMDRPLEPPPGNDPVFTVTGSAAPNGAGTSASVQLPYWKFDSTGVIDESTFPAGDHTPYERILLFPGFIDTQGNEISTQNANGAGNRQSAQLEEIRVIPSTGRARYTADPSNNLSTPSSTP